ncbi:hypothetical protein EASAB2608_01761 [Streptomyces sp. EAS-AB2608]|nr:hypothetical protein EASAB2608_01761 [Streptomyces sp. EAS-AB2608]
MPPSAAGTPARADGAVIAKAPIQSLTIVRGTGPKQAVGRALPRRKHTADGPQTARGSGYPLRPGALSHVEVQLELVRVRA